MGEGGGGNTSFCVVSATFVGSDSVDMVGKLRGIALSRKDAMISSNEVVISRIAGEGESLHRPPYTIFSFLVPIGSKRIL
jgi:hypothetical protein